VTDAQVEAAGGLVVDHGRLAIVHRPHRDDWSLPKGHLDPGEDHETAALREVLEETGLRCRVTGPAGSTSYVDRRGRSKRVRYFSMIVESGEFAVNDEVDELRWVTTDELSVLTYPSDIALVRAHWPRTD
jgi:8-oxo-dGTP diphosphatase